MELFELFMSGDYYIYSASIAIAILIMVLEITLSSTGFSMSNLIDGDIFVNGLSWLNKSGIPFIIVMILFLMSFGIAGLALILQFSFINMYLLAIPTLVIAIMFTRTMSSLISKVMPKTETTVISEHSHIGEIATITIGTCTKTDYAEAKVQDAYQRTHYIMVISYDEDISTGEKCLIIKRNGDNKFTVTRDINFDLENFQNTL